MTKPLSILAMIVIIVIASCQSNSSNSILGSEKTAEDIRAELKQKEQTEFYKYIDAKASMRRNLLGETVFEGTISNSATLSSFKDIGLEISFISKTGAMIETQTKIVYEIVEAGKAVAFKIKTMASKDAATFSFKITNATPF